MAQPQPQPQLQLQQLQFPVEAWPHVSTCLTTKDVPGNPCPEIVPIPNGKNYMLIVGMSITFDWDKWEQLGNSSCIFLTPTRA